jgi:Protein of unknown function (DUF2786)
MADRNSIIEKIKALLAKTTANGATEAEMMSALDKASAMMDAYDVSDADVQITKAEAAALHADPSDLARGVSSQASGGVGAKVGDLRSPWCFSIHPLKVANRRIFLALALPLIRYGGEVAGSG